MEWATDATCDDGRKGPNFLCEAWGCDARSCESEGLACAATAEIEPKCWIDVYPGSTKGEWLIGDPFFRAFYVAFDVGEPGSIKHKVGLAPSFPLSETPARVEIATKEPTPEPSTQNPTNEPTYAPSCGLRRPAQEVAAAVADGRREPRYSAETSRGDATDDATAT